MKPILKFGLVLMLWQAVAIHAATTVINVAAGYGHSLFIKSDGSLWCMGDNRGGQLGNGTLDGTNRPEQMTASNVVAIAGGAGFSLFLKSNGSLWAVGYNGYGSLGDGTWNNTNQPEQIVSSNVVAVAAGASHGLFIKSDSSLWAMGGTVMARLVIQHLITSIFQKK